MQLPDIGKSGDGLDIEIIESVAGIKPHPRLADESACFSNFLNLGDHFGAVCIPTEIPEGVGVGAGVDLTDLEVTSLRRLDLVGLGVDKRADDDSSVPKPTDDLPEPLCLAGDIEPSFSGDFLAAFRHEHGKLGLGFAGDGDHLLGRGHFEVELDLDQLRKATEIVILDVAAIFPEMQGDSIRAAELGLGCCPDRVGFVGPSCLSDRCDMVDVHAQFDHIA